MLFHLASWILLLAVGAVIGTAILFVFKCSLVFSHVGDRVIVATWLGLLTMAAALLALSVITPLTPSVSFGLLAILTAVALSMHSVRRDLRLLLSYLSRPVIFGLAILGMSAALNSTRTVEAYDTGLYHYQFVRWLSQYGTVRGFAVLEERFGFTSSWFALAAPFDFGPFQGRVAGLTGGVAIFLCFLHLALAACRVLYRRANRADWFLVGGYVLIIPICIAWAFEVSLSQDLPVWVLTVLTGWLMLVVGNRESDRKSDAVSDNRAILPLLVAAGALPIKLSAAPMVLVAGIFYWMNSSTKWVKRSVLAAGAMLISLPMFVANVISSACPLYPNSFFCLDVDWSVGKAAAQESAVGIKEWARWGGPTPPGATAWNWILPWFSHLDKLFLILLCCLCLGGFVAARGWRADQSSLYVLALALVGNVFVLVSAPNPRFGAGYLALCPALFLASVGTDLGALGQRWLPDPVRIKPSEALAYLLVTIAILVAVQGSVRELRLTRSIQRELKAVTIPADHSFLSRLAVPPALASSPGDLTYTRNRRFDTPSTLDLLSESYNGIDYRRPRVGVGGQCWGAAIPCLPHPLTGDVHLRDPNSGFSRGFIRLATAP
jgi:hypothetical protein